MRVLLQRVKQAQVRVEDQVVGAIGPGYGLLVGIGHCDTEAEVVRLARKVVSLRLFAGEGASDFDRSLLDVGGAALVVSQFTLYGNAKKGRRPSFTGAAPPALAEPLCEQFANSLREQGVERVEMGRFGHQMQVSLVNDGPVTLWLDSAEM